MIVLTIFREPLWLYLTDVTVVSNMSSVITGLCSCSNTLSGSRCRLLELGYEKDIAEIITILNQRSSEERQTILLSATLSAGEVITLWGCCFEVNFDVHNCWSDLLC